MSGSVKGLASKRVHVFPRDRELVTDTCPNAPILNKRNAFGTFEPSQELSDLLAHSQGFS
jgi:hypothetical protein